MAILGHARITPMLEIYSNVYDEDQRSRYGQMQVKLPVKLARELRLQAGDEFYWRRSDADPAVLLLIPSEVVERRYSAGEALEAATRPATSDLNDHRHEGAT
jgi:hypothetical protein